MLMAISLIFASVQSLAVESTISVKLLNYIGNKTSVDISSSGVYKVTGTNVSTVKRYAGQTLYDTANLIASDGWKNPSTLVIINKNAFSDAISATPLAHKLKAPILYTESNQLTKATETQIKSMQPDNILIIGGTTVVTPRVESTLKKYGRVKRISGSTKYITAQNIAKELGSYSEAMLVTGNSFADGASIASYAARHNIPIFTTAKDSLPKYQLPKKVTIIGGEGAINKSVENEVKKQSTVTRIGGSTLHDVSANIVKKFNMNAEKLYMARNTSFSDAISLSLMAALNNSAMVLIQKEDLTTPITNLIKEKGTHSFILSGGKSAISEKLEKKISDEFYMKKNTNYQLNIHNGKISVKGIKTFGASLRVVPEKYSTQNVIKIAGRDYLGKVNFAIESGYIRPINEQIPFEDYLKGVIPNEMPANWNVEALKAQAVAARTYSLNSTGKTVPDTTAFQVYGGYNWYANSTKAVNETKGKVLKYNNQLISATYYSSNGGYTEASEEVWTNPIAYLVAKTDSKDPKTAWTLKLYKTQLSSRLNTNSPSSWWGSQAEANASQLVGLKNWILKNKESGASEMKISSISNLSFSGKTKGQRAKTANITLKYHLKNKTGTYSTNKTATFSFKSSDFRSVIGATNMKSTYASVINNTNDFTISGKGYGHGVGMSQYGAKARAESGDSYSSILSFYYPGAKLTNN